MTKQNKKKDNRKNNIIFLILMSIILLGLILISFYVKPKDIKKSGLFAFDINDFQYISPIDLEMFKASLHYEGTSIIFLCNNESEQCYNEVDYLNSIAKSYQLNIEYMNILELVDAEKEELKKQTDVISDELYPNLLIIKDNNIIDNSNDYLEQDEIINLLTKNNII